MPEQFTKVTRVGLGTRFTESLKGVIIGIILFLASFVVLWVNEGRIDMSKIAKKAILVNPNQIEVTAEGKLISVSDTLTTSETIGDPDYLKPGNYIKLVRIVEMYAWSEKEETKTEKKLGGGEERITTYTYVKEWTTNPEESAAFYRPEGHENPYMTIRGQTFIVRTANVGVYKIDPQSVQLPEPRAIIITSDKAILGNDLKLVGGYIFTGKGSLAEPQIGDLRISFSAVESGISATLFGKLQEGKVVPYYYKGKHRLYRVLEGTRDVAIATMAREHKVMTWILRGIGFLMMWFGLCLFFDPINTLLDILPFLGGVSRTLIRVAMFAVALVLSLITIVISAVVHNIVALIIVIILIVGGIWFWKKRRNPEIEKPAPNLP